MDEDGLQAFLKQAAGHRLLAAHEEKALGRRVQNGGADGIEARDELVLCNIRLVISVARYYRNRGLSMEDLVQLGYTGLNRAAEKFDPERGIRFSTYATLWIKQAIQRGLTSGGTAIRLPSQVSASRAKVRAAQLRYPDADHEFIADLLDLDVKEVERVLDAAEVVTSLDREMATDDHSHSMLDNLADPLAADPLEGAMQDELSADVRAALSAMEKDADRTRGKQRRRVIELHFGLTGQPPMSIAQVAKKLGVNPNTAKTRRTEGMKYLTHALDHYRE